MNLFDIHTHNSTTGIDTAILDCGMHYCAERRISAGIHPWHITPDWEKEFAGIETASLKENVAAIGECGIDKIHSPASIEVQKAVLRAHAMLAEERRKPLILHCVKGVEEIITLHREMKPAQAWIVHGFRGKPQMAAQLAKEGFYISFGEKFNPDSVKVTPAERMFVESDESNCGIEEIYKAIAAAKECSIEELAAQTEENARGINIKL